MLKYGLGSKIYWQRCTRSFKDEYSEPMRSFKNEGCNGQTKLSKRDC